MKYTAVIAVLWASSLACGVARGAEVSGGEVAAIKELIRKRECREWVCWSEPPSVTVVVGCDAWEYRVVVDADLFYVLRTCVRGEDRQRNFITWQEWWIVEESGQRRFRIKAESWIPMDLEEGAHGEWQKKSVAEWRTFWDALRRDYGDEEAVSRLKARFGSPDCVRFRVAKSEDCRVQDCHSAYPTTPQGQQVLEAVVRAVVDKVVWSIKKGAEPAKLYRRGITVVVKAFDEHEDSTLALVLNTRDVYEVVFADPPSLVLKRPLLERREEYEAVLHEAPLESVIRTILKYGIWRRVALPGIEVEDGRQMGIESRGTPTPQPR